MKPDGGATGVERPIPRTTNADVIALADYWTAQLADVKTDHGHRRRHRDVACGDRGRRPARAHGADPNAVYAKNNAFWRALSTTAIHVAVADEAPTKWDLAKDAIKDSVTHLPDTLSTVASKSAEALADTAHAAGKVVNEAGKGPALGRRRAASHRRGRARRVCSLFRGRRDATRPRRGQPWTRSRSLSTRRGS